MAAPFTTVTEIAAPVDAVFQHTLLRNAKARCPYFVGAVPATIQEHEGSFTARWRRIENLTPTTTALTALTGNISHPIRDSVKPSITAITKAVSKYGQYILLNEEVVVVNFNEQADKLVEILGISAGRSLNRLQRNELEDNATLIYSNGVSSDVNITTKLQKGDIRNAVNTLQRNSALKFTPMSAGSQNVGSSPMRESFWGACHVDVEEDIRDMAGFIAVESYAGHTRTAPGEFGALGGVRWIGTEEASIDVTVGTTDTASSLLRSTSTKIDIYSSVVFGMEAVGALGFGEEHVKDVYMAGDPLPAVLLITKEPGTAGWVDPYNEVRTMAWKSWHGAKILNTNWIRSIRSGATAPANL